VSRVPRLVSLPASAWLVAATVWLAWPAASAGAQFPVGRIVGTVRDIAGRPIEGASVHAVNPAGIPSEFSTESDKKGAWSILGPRSGRWTVSAEAEGFESAAVAIPVNVFQRGEPVDFVLVAVPARTPLEGVDTKQLQADLGRADTLMAEERWDEAVAAYREILARVPLLDTVNLAIGRALRTKKDYAGAEAAYRALLKRDAKNQKALLGVGRTQRERGDQAAAIATLEQVVAIDGATDEAAAARELLAAMRK